MLKKAKPAGVQTRVPPAASELNGGVRLLPDALPALPVVALQPFDSGVTLLRCSGVAVGPEFLGNFGKDVAVVRVPAYAPLHLNGGDIPELHTDAGPNYPRTFTHLRVSPNLQKDDCLFIRPGHFLPVFNSTDRL